MNQIRALGIRHSALGFWVGDAGLFLKPKVQRPNAKRKPGLHLARSGAKAIFVNQLLCGRGSGKLMPCGDGC